MMILIGLTVVFYLPVWVKVHKNAASTGIGSGMDVGVPPLEFFIAQSHAKGSDRRINAVGPRLRIKDNEKPSGELQELEERIRYLETKLNAYLAFTSDPFLGIKYPAQCNNKRPIKELACSTSTCELDDQVVCLDTFPHLQGYKQDLSGLRGVHTKDTATASTQQKDCVVYDFGIRESPEYGLAFSGTPFNCSVTGFDPSPISHEWWKRNQAKIREDHPKYTFMGVGAGGVDGSIELREYDWGQVSILQYPKRVIDTSNCTKEGACRYKFYKQEAFTIPVKTLQTIMSELGHNRIDLLKLVGGMPGILLISRA
jgi:hypothetical protein